MLSKKSSRAITVGDDTYRWAIAPDGQWVTLVVQHAEVNGQRLEIRIQVHFSSQAKLYAGVTNPAPIRVVKPALVAELIARSLEIGWLPKTARPPLELTLERNDDLKVRRGLGK
ncbi:MAG: hypothetical protein ACRBCJ_01700 [Hyphomicrobiaceae bacterium]